MIKETDNGMRFLRSSNLIVIAIVLILTSAVAIYAQPAPTDSDAMNRRLARARALTAAHNLTAAAFELDAIRTATTDDVIRDVARIMLIGIYLEQADYGRARSLLDETYKARSRANEVSSRSYFAVAGQTVNGIRAHLDRFRALGLNVGSPDLPSEAVSDLDRVRNLLEHLAQQAKEIGAEDVKNTDAFALLEDVANVRSSLARDAEERETWQDEVAGARQHLAASETRVASISGGALMTASSSSPARNRQPSQPATVDAEPRVQAPPVAPPVAPPAAPPKESNTAKESSSAKVEPAASSNEPVNIGSLLDQASEKVNPSYPAFAKSAHVAGIVRVDIIVDEKGTVLSAVSNTGPSVLRQAAIDASKRWKFRPTIRNGKPVKVAGFLNFNFTTR